MTPFQVGEARLNTIVHIVAIMLMQPTSKSIPLSSDDREELLCLYNTHLVARTKARIIPPCEYIATIIRGVKWRIVRPSPANEARDRLAPNSRTPKIIETMPTPQLSGWWHSAGCIPGDCVRGDITSRDHHHLCSAAMLLPQERCWLKL